MSEIKIIDSNARTAQKRIYPLRNKFDKFNFFFTDSNWDYPAHVSVYFKKGILNGIFCMDIHRGDINLYNKKYLENAKEIAEFLGLKEIYLHYYNDVLRDKNGRKD